MTWTTRLLTVVTVVLVQVLTFAGCLVGLVPFMRALGLKGEWPANLAGGLLVFIVAPAVALTTVGKLRGFALSWRPLLAILIGDTLLTAVLLRLPTEATSAQAFAFVSGTVIAIIAVPLLGSFLIRQTDA